MRKTALRRDDQAVQSERAAAFEPRVGGWELEADLARTNRISMMGELAASLAHEIRQPITGVAINTATCLRWLESDPPRIDDLRRKLSAILEDVKRATNVINRNHALYGRGRPRLEAVDLNAAVRQVIDLLHDAAERNAVTVRTELDPALAITTADGVQLQQVLMNLMLNAIEAMKDGGVLTIASGPGRDGHLMITVSDSGMGLPPEGAERVFEAFFTTKPEGTGIGLSLSRRIIESHGGRLWANANTPRGAAFHFTLPVIQPTSPLVSV